MSQPETISVLITEPTVVKTEADSTGLSITSVKPTLSARYTQLSSINKSPQIKICAENLTYLRGNYVVFTFSFRRL